MFSFVSIRRMLKVILALGLVWLAWVIWSYFFGVEAVVEPFDHKVWKENSAPYERSSDPGCVRGGMALDLIGSKRVIGKNTKEIEALLGPASRNDSSIMHYELGQCSGLGWKNSILVIVLDSSGLASSLQIKVDR